jgi:hypothetical protein
MKRAMDIVGGVGVGWEEDGTGRDSRLGFP